MSLLLIMVLNSYIMLWIGLVLELVDELVLY